MTSAFLQRYAAAFGKSKALLLSVAGMSSPEISARGAIVADAAGEEWIDLGSFGLHLLGHRPPRVEDALREQARRMGLGTKLLGNDRALALAESLVRVTPPSLNEVLLANSGSEAIETALKMAALATGRRRFLALRRSYHGRTAGALSLSESVPRRRDLVSGDNVVHVAPEDLAALEESLQTHAFAAIFVEPIRGEGGVLPVSTESLRMIRRLCDDTGTLLVLDEIQTGLGRCGTLFRAAGTVVDPDILCLGKILGGGYVPLAALIYDKRRLGSTASDPLIHASSFAGGALAAEVGRVVVDEVSRSAFLERVRELGARGEALLRQRLRSHPAVVDLRGAGLMWGLELQTSSLAGDVLIEAARRRVLVSFCLSAPAVLRIYPPATLMPQELEDAVEKICLAVDAAWGLDERAASAMTGAAKCPS